MKLSPIQLALAALIASSASLFAQQDGPPPNHPPHPLFLALDADDDGVISAEEIANAAAALKALDKDRDGRLSREELRPPRRPAGGPPDRPAGRPELEPDPEANPETRRQRRRRTPDADASTTSDSPTSRIAWFSTWASAAAEAKRTNRPIFLISAAPHCHNISGIW